MVLETYGAPPTPELTKVDARRERRRAAARLRLRVSDLLHAALEKSHLSRSELIAVLDATPEDIESIFEGNGNISVNELANLLAATGYEADIQPVELGEILSSMTEHRAPRWVELTIRDSHRRNVQPSFVYVIQQDRVEGSQLDHGSTEALSKTPTWSKSADASDRKTKQSGSQHTSGLEKLSWTFQ